jgi:hypothetical protein
MNVRTAISPVKNKPAHRLTLLSLPVGGSVKKPVYGGYDPLFVFNVTRLVFETPFSRQLETALIPRTTTYNAYAVSVAEIMIFFMVK